MNDQSDFSVVTNQDLQYSIWPAKTDLPPGWTREGFVGSRSSCLAYLERTWHDIRPAVARTSDSFGRPNPTAGGWLPRWSPAPSASQGPVVFCFPYAAGSAHSYLAWSQASRLQLLPLAYPGRGERSDEASIEDMETLADTIAEFVTNYAEQHELESFAFFGHSMGALVAFATASSLRRSKRHGPSMLAVSASPAPHLPIVNPLADLDNEGLITAISALQDPQARSQSRDELHSVFLPILRNDLELCETYHPSAEQRVDCPILAVAADDDPRVAAARVQKWADLTTAACEFQSTPGAHFYFERDFGAINRALEEALGFSDERTRSGH